MEKQNRIRNLSTRWLVPLKVTLFVLYSVLFFTIAYFKFSTGGWFRTISFFAIYGYLFYLIFRTLAKLQHVEFDDDFLYVVKRKLDYVIPLENIKSVEIVSLGGVYKVTLYRAEQLGEEFYFKPSLWYPLNYKTKDLLVNLLRRNIDLAKQRKQTLPYNALMS